MQQKKGLTVVVTASADKSNNGNMVEYSYMKKVSYHPCR